MARPVAGARPSRCVQACARRMTALRPAFFRRDPQQELHEAVAQLAAALRRLRPVVERVPGHSSDVRVVECELPQPGRRLRDLGGCRAPSTSSVGQSRSRSSCSLIVGGAPAGSSVRAGSAARRPASPACARRPAAPPRSAPGRRAERFPPGSARSSCSPTATVRSMSSTSASRDRLRSAADGLAQPDGPAVGPRGRGPQPPVAVLARPLVYQGPDRRPAAPGPRPAGPGRSPRCCGPARRLSSAHGEITWLCT